MPEHQAALAHSATASAGARPRISADAFRNLTARLKKPDAYIPDMLSPVAAAVLPQPETFAEARPIVVEPVRVEPVHVEPIRVEAVHIEPIQFEPVQIEPVHVEAVQFEKFHVEPVHVEPVHVEPVHVEPLHIDPVAIEPLAVSISTEHVELAEAPIPDVFADTIEEFVVEPLQMDAAAHIVVMQQEIAPLTTMEVTTPAMALELAPFEPLQPHVLPETVEAAPLEAAPVHAIEDGLDPNLPAFVETPVAVLTPAAPEPELAGSFAENFTFVPENGKDAETPTIDLEDVGEAVKQEVAQRATELELENNWRLLLAKPTGEDRATYLREAAEYHATDEEWNKPAPEFDLSQIEPAADIQPEPSFEMMPIQPVLAERSLVDIVPVGAGQDLAELSRSLLDMMAAGNSSGLPQERALAADTLLRLVPRLELKPVVLLAQRLAMMDNPPHLLVTRLIRDNRVEVAGPLLEDCAHITDKDLESVVQEGEPDKLRLIARRRRLTRAISDALIKSGDPSVVLTLVRNAEAEISHDGFQSLLVLCENNPELLAPLATRQDLSAPMAFEMFWLAPAQLRRFILSRFLTDSETLTKILKITMATNMGEESDGEPLSQHAMLEALERAARGHTEVAAEELSNLMQVSAATVMRILSDHAGEPLVIMLKAAGYPRSAVQGLLKRMQDADLPLVTRDRDVSDLQSMFETLSFNKARILLTYWDWAQKKLGPYAPVH